MKRIIIAEKPSVAEDIARVLKVDKKEKGYHENDEYVVTWAVGHLLELFTPEDIDKKYRAWLLENLPIIPSKFEYKVVSKTKSQYDVIRKLLKRKDVGGVVNACDAGREGELIFREIIANEKVKLPIERLWLSSMTTKAIQEGFKNLKNGEEFEGLADAAKSRSESDWLIGMNCTRAVTKRLRSKSEKSSFSVGRVQTPTLSMVVERELEILRHEPRPYWKIEADFCQSPQVNYSGILQFKESGDNPDRIFDQDYCQKIVERMTDVLQKAAVKAEAGDVIRIQKQNPYPLFDLTSLQREASTRFGFSAYRTLQAAQRLYERDKLLTYPRTDSRCLPEDYVDYLKNALVSLRSLRGMSGLIEPVLNKINGANRFIFDNSRVSDHFAIIPTGETPGKKPDGDEGKIFDLVVRRTIAAFYPACEWEIIERTTVLEKDLIFKSRGKNLKKSGWLEVFGKQEMTPGEGGKLLPLNTGKQGKQLVDLIDFRKQDFVTKPPARIGEARLLTLMEFAGKQLDDEELYEAMDGKGIGTPATRADIIENLVSKGYMIRAKSGFMATSKAIRLMDVLNRVDVKRLSSVKLTAEIQAMLKDVEQGGLTRKKFMKAIEDYVCEVVEQMKTFRYEDLYVNDEPAGQCPLCGKNVLETMYGYACEKGDGGSGDGCPFFVRKDYSGRYIDRNNLRRILHEGGFEDSNFTFPGGGLFSGKVLLKEDGTVELLMKTDDGFAPLRAKSTSELQEQETTEWEEPKSSTYFAQDGVFRKTNAAFYFEVPLFPKALGKPPKNHDGKNFVARLPREVCSRPMSEKEALSFFVDGKTELLTKFVSKRGRYFNAKLFVKPNGKYGFEFEPRTKAGGKSAKEAEKQQDS
jgi:DNA topoisomerase-3